MPQYNVVIDGMYIYVYMNEECVKSDEREVHRSRRYIGIGCNIFTYSLCRICGVGIEIHTSKLLFVCVRCGSIADSPIAGHVHFEFDAVYMCDGDDRYMARGGLWVGDALLSGRANLGAHQSSSSRRVWCGVEMKGI